MNSLEGSRILISGGAGCIGSTIADQLLEENIQEIIILDNLVRGSKANIQNAVKSKKVKFIKGDIRNKSLLDEIYQGVDYSFHMAALRITQCAAEPREALEVMVDGTYNVAEACVKNNVKKLIAASSASVYGQADSFPTKEDHHPYNNHTFYGAAKMFNELMLHSFHQMYGLNYNILRYFNVYGPRIDIEGKYLEVLIKWYHMINDGRNPLIFGDGKQTMDFIYVDEVAQASILALKSDVTDDAFNVASGKETSLEELCYSLLEIMKSKLRPQYVPLHEERKNVEVRRRQADVSRANREIGFEAKVTLKEGLTKLVKWLDAQKNEMIG